MGERRFFTSESVTEGHPDKVCDAISDSVLDACLAQDPNSRVACETAVTTGLVMILGEITTQANIDFQKIARDAIREIGYTDAATGFDADTCAVIVAMDKQSPDIAMGVDKAFEAKENEFANEAVKAAGEGTFANESAAGGAEGNETVPAIEALENTLTEEEIESIGAGDQGMMFGYATNQTPELMPYPISLASKLALQLSRVRKDGTLAYLRPDGKTQVSVEYDENGKPARLEAIVVSTQHDPKVSQQQIHRDIRKYVIDQVVPEGMIDGETKIYINPTGRFVIGGPQGDAGLTGRKIIVDTYGGYASHGGGAFSGKDPTKVDRSAAYAARYIAKNIVAAGLADEVQIEVSYAIGVAQPMSITVDTRGTGRLSNSRIAEIVRENFDLRPAGIIRMLDLRRPIYRATAAYGHFGRTDVEFPWERTDKAEVLRKYLG